jgi:hypothetical protein
MEVVLSSDMSHKKFLLTKNRRSAKKEKNNKREN